MTALLCKERGPAEALCLEEVVPPEVSKGTVRIGVHAAGVNFPAPLINAGKYQAVVLVSDED